MKSNFSHGHHLAKLITTFNGNEITVRESIDPSSIHPLLDFRGADVCEVDVCLKAEAYGVMMEKFPTGVNRTFSFVVGKSALAQFCAVLLEELRRKNVN